MIRSRPRSSRSGDATSINLILSNRDCIRLNSVFYSGTEAKRISFSAKRWVQAAQALGVSTDYLAGLTDDPEPAARLAAKVSELEDAGANPDDERVLGSLAFRDDWLRRHGLNPKRCRVIEVTGDSMEPTLQHRAMILVDFQRTIRRRNKIFAVRTEDGPVVKRLRRDEDGWQLASDNKAYQPVPWPRDAQVIGQVMWTGRTL